MEKKILVVGAAVLRDGKVLATKRDFNRSLGSLWEFPGGKIEKNEQPEEALKREMQEEFGAEVLVGNKVTETSTVEYDFGTINLTVYFTKLITKTFSLKAHSKVEWMDPNNLRQLEWAPADLKAVDFISKNGIGKAEFK